MDPNKNWQPLHLWTNDLALNYLFSQSDFASRYHEFARRQGIRGALQEPSYDIFAFQEISNKNNSLQNDKNMFSSIILLMKAQAHQLSIPPDRKKDLCVYHFSLLSVVDADLVRIKFCDSGDVVYKVLDESYVARYIIREKNCESKNRFINAGLFQQCLQDYNNLHRANCCFFGQEKEKFYVGIFGDWKRIRIYEEHFVNRARRPVMRLIAQKTNSYEPINKVQVSFSDSKQRLFVAFPEFAKWHGMLNDSEDVRENIAKLLKQIYRYEGEFEIGYNIVDGLDDDIDF